jgi:hypothetical protein
MRFVAEFHDMQLVSNFGVGPDTGDLSIGFVPWRAFSQSASSGFVSTAVGQSERQRFGIGYRGEFEQGYAD